MAEKDKERYLRERKEYDEKKSERNLAEGDREVKKPLGKKSKVKPRPIIKND